MNVIQKYNYPSFICTSYAKNFGLYSERVGTLLFNGGDDDTTQLVKENLKSLIRRSYSSPPSNGSNIIKTILNNQVLYNIWIQELANIGTHYQEIRNDLKKGLEHKYQMDFSDITKQKGMFYYSRISPEDNLKMREKGIYFPDDGRISLTLS